MGTNGAARFAYATRTIDPNDCVRILCNLCRAVQGYNDHALVTECAAARCRASFCKQCISLHCSRYGIEEFASHNEGWLCFFHRSEYPPTLEPDMDRYHELEEQL